MSLEHFAMDPRLPVDEMVDLQELWESDSFESKHGTEEPHSVEGWPYMNVALTPDEMEDMELKSVIILRDRLMTDAAYCPDLQAEFAAFPPLNEHEQKHSSEGQSGDLHQTQHSICSGHRELDAHPDHVVSVGCNHCPKDNKEQCNGPVTLLPPVEIKSEPLSQPASPQSESCRSTNLIHSLSTGSAKPMELAFHVQSNSMTAYSYASQFNPIFFPTASGSTDQCARRNRCNPPTASESQSASSFVPKMNISENGSNGLAGPLTFTSGVPHMSHTNHTELKCNPLSIKMEAATRVAFLPPTPPSSHTSDCEGGLSPLRDRESQMISITTSSASSNAVSLRSLSSVPSTISDVSYHSRHHVLSSHKLGSGTLYLTEEEKRILIAEGYPIPIKYPLTKVEEKSLKKIRRKIKNKISAQESRRKKKEYLDALERRSDMLAAENIEFRRRVMELESSNLNLQNQLRSLEESLQHLQKNEKNPSVAPSMVTTSGAN